MFGKQKDQSTLCFDHSLECIQCFLEGLSGRDPRGHDPGGTLRECKVASYYSLLPNPFQAFSLLC